MFVLKCYFFIQNISIQISNAFLLSELFYWIIPEFPCIKYRYKNDKLIIDILIPVAIELGTTELSVPAIEVITPGLDKFEPT